MKKFILYTLLVLGLSCSDDEDVVTTEPEEEALLLSDFSIVSFDDDAFYEYRFDQNTQEATSLNLTEQQGIDRQVFFVHRNESIFGFYNQGNCFVKDFSANTIAFVDDFGGEPGEERITARNDNETLAILYTFPNSTNYFLRVIDIVSNFQFNVALGELGPAAKLYVKGENVYVVHNTDQNAQIQRISKENQSVENQMIFDNTVSGLVFGEAQDLFVFSFSGSFKRINASDLSEISTGVSSFVPSDSFTYKYRNGLVYSQFEYPQPNFYLAGPQAYNLETGEEIQVDIATVFDNYIGEQEDTFSVQPVHFDYDIANQVWIVAFTAQIEMEEERYGYFVINEAGEIVRETSLERIPWTVIAHN